MSLKKKDPLGETKGRTEIRDCIPNLSNEKNDVSVSEMDYFGKSELLSKGCVDTVFSINDKPSVEAEGTAKLRDCAPEPTKRCDSHIVAHGRISRNKETTMSIKFEGYITIPRFIWNDKRWNSLPILYRALLQELFFLVVYKPEDFNVFGEIIKIQPGQYGCSIDTLIEKIGGKKLFPKTSVWRALKLFHQYGWIKVETYSKSIGISNAFSSDVSKSEHNAKQKKTIITITAIDTYEDSKKEPGTVFGTVFGTVVEQSWNTKERSERKGINKRSDLSDKGSEEGIAFAERSPLLSARKGKKRKFSPEELTMLKEVCNPWNISEKSMRVWLSKFEPVFIFAQLDVLRNRSDIDNAEKWLEMAFKKDYAGTFKNIEKNREFAVRFKEKHRWDHLKILKQYCNLEIEGGAVEDFQMRLDPALFREMLIRKFENYGDRR